MPRKSMKSSTIFTSFCKLCLSVTDELVDITSNAYDFNIMDLIFETLDIKLLKSNSTFPCQYICCNCLALVKLFKYFKSRCRHSQETLNKHIIRDIPAELPIIYLPDNHEMLKDYVDQVDSVYRECSEVFCRYYEELYESNNAKNVIQIRLLEDESEKDESTHSLKQEIGDSHLTDFEYIIEEEDVVDDDIINSVNIINNQDSAEAPSSVESKETKKRKGYKTHECEICHKFYDGYEIKYHKNTHLSKILKCMLAQ